MVIQLFATFRVGRGKEVDIPWYEGIDGHVVLNALGLKPDDVKIFLINGRHGKPDALLKSGDTVSLFPAVGGG